MDADVVVLGAGAAGLMAARRLGEAGRTTLVLEARDRLGGRMFSRDDPGFPAPLDLGPEFVHGLASETFALLRESGTSALDRGGEGWTAQPGGGFAPRDEGFGPGAGLLARELGDGPDRSVADVLRSVAHPEQQADAIRWARSMVEGFDAADPERASARAIVDEWGGAASLDEPQFRPSRGYAPLVRRLFAALDPRRATVHLQTVVQTVRWDGRTVEVSALRCGREERFSARAAIVTLPIGVLQAQTVRFEPPLPAATQRALDQLVMGPVVKLVLGFREAFWETADGGRYRDATFFNVPDGAFATFWTQSPLRIPVLSAWAGGPRADALAGLDGGELAGRACDELARAFRCDVRALLSACWWHDWQADPFARGAYSYVATGGADARRALGEPIGERLVIAGEATALAGEGGTVAGALQSGERAARAVHALIA